MLHLELTLTFFRSKMQTRSQRLVGSLNDDPSQAEDLGTDASAPVSADASAPIPPTTKKRKRSVQSYPSNKAPMYVHADGVTAYQDGEHLGSDALAEYEPSERLLDAILAPVREYVYIPPKKTAAEKKVAAAAAKKKAAPKATRGGRGGGRGGRGGRGNGGRNTRQPDQGANGSSNENEDEDPDQDPAASRTYDEQSAKEYLKKLQDRQRVLRATFKDIGSQQTEILEEMSERDLRALVRDPLAHTEAEAGYSRIQAGLNAKLEEARAAIRAESELKMQLVENQRNAAREVAEQQHRTHCEEVRNEHLQGAQGEITLLKKAHARAQDDNMTVLDGDEDYFPHYHTASTERPRGYSSLKITDEKPLYESLQSIDEHARQEVMDEEIFKPLRDSLAKQNAIHQAEAEVKKTQTIDALSYAAIHQLQKIRGYLVPRSLHSRDQQAWALSILADMTEQIAVRHPSQAFAYVPLTPGHTFPREGLIFDPLPGANLRATFERAQGLLPPPGPPPQMPRVSYPSSAEEVPAINTTTKRRRVRKKQAPEATLYPNQIPHLNTRLGIASSPTSAAPSTTTPGQQPLAPAPRRLSMPPPLNTLSQPSPIMPPPNFRHSSYSNAATQMRSANPSNSTPATPTSGDRSRRWINQGILPGSTTSTTTGPSTSTSTSKKPTQTAQPNGTTPTDPDYRPNAYSQLPPIEPMMYGPNHPFARPPPPPPPNFTHPVAPRSTLPPPYSYAPTSPTSPGAGSTTTASNPAGALPGTSISATAGGVPNNGTHTSKMSVQFVNNTPESTRAKAQKKQQKRKVEEEERRKREVERERVEGELRSVSGGGGGNGGMGGGGGGAGNGMGGGGRMILPRPGL